MKSREVSEVIEVTAELTPFTELEEDTDEGLAEISDIEGDSEPTSDQVEEISLTQDAGFPMGSPETGELTSQEEANTEDTLKEETVIEEEIPEWLAEINFKDESSEEEQPLSESQAGTFEPDMPAWLLDAQQDSEEEVEPTRVPTDADNEDGETELPDWLLQDEESTEQPSSTGFITGEDAPDWLSTELETEEIVSEEFEVDIETDEEYPLEVPKQDEGIESQPEISTIEEYLSSEEQAEIDKGQSSSDIETPVQTAIHTGTDEAADPDSAFAWLEGLAARQGAAEETLLIPPEERLETPPEWVSQSEDELGEEAVQVDFASSEGEDIDFSEPVITDQIEDTQPTGEVFTGIATDEGELPELIYPSEMTGESEQISEGEGSAIEEDVPEWLSEFEEKSSDVEAKTESIPEELPEWIRDLEKEQDVQPEVAPSSGWVPEFESSQVTTEQIEQSVPQLAEEVEHLSSDQTLKTAQAALDAYNVERALEHYNRLIQNGEHLEEIIHDLRDALYRYPIDIAIWQSLGDAYMRSNRLQEALDAYTKAEELLR
jgi:hypothetical protein